VSLLFLDLGALLLAGLERRERGIGAGWMEREADQIQERALGHAGVNPRTTLRCSARYTMKKEGHNGAEVDQAGQQQHQDVENLTRTTANSS
jgi:hypothetical protein